MGIRALLLAGMLAVPLGAAIAQQVEGPLRVHGGGVVEVGGTWMQLIGTWGLGAHEICTRDAEPVHCGLIAMGRLVEWSAGRTVRCDVRTFARDDRVWGLCADAALGADVRSGESLNRRWVAAGWAFSSSQHIEDFVGDSRTARAAGLGMWAMERATPASIESRVTAGVTVLDANTLLLGGVAIRLEGVDGPELTQTCVTRRHEIDCGELAMAGLIRLTMGHAVTCDLTGSLADARVLGVCGTAGGVTLDAHGATLNRLIVESGWALAQEDASEDLVAAQAAAQAAGRGLWAYEFVPPAQWRRGLR